VFRSSTICEIETFITLESSTMMNCADARIMRGSHLRTARLYAVQPQPAAAPRVPLLGRLPDPPVELEGLMPTRRAALVVSSMTS
jgi:hypothetical protein